MTRYLDIERKFDVVDSTVSPSFDGLAAVARVERAPSQQLDAIYFDTPGRDLAAHHITLRRRTGGPDAGWHLKLPAGPDARTEVRTPLGPASDDVPEELRDVVLAIVRDRPLAPVARITTRRTVDHLYDAAGRILAEFADDQVTAWADGDDAEQHWREWELEVSDERLLDRLGNRLFDAGAEPAGHGSKLARVLDSSAPEAGLTAATRRPRSPVPWPRKWTTCWHGTVLCAGTCTTRCIRCRVHHAEASEPAADVGVGVRVVGRRVDFGRIAAVGLCAGNRAGRRGARRTIRESAGRAARRAGARSGARPAGRRGASPLSLGVAKVVGCHAFSAILPPARRA